MIMVFLALILKVARVFDIEFKQQEIGKQVIRIIFIILTLCLFVAIAYSFSSSIVMNPAAMLLPIA